MNRHICGKFWALLIGFSICSVGCDKKSGRPLEDESRPAAQRLRVPNASTTGSDKLVDLVRSLTSRKEITNDDIDALYNRLDQISPQDFDELWNSLQQLEVSTYLKYRLLSRSLHGLALSGSFDKALGIAKLESVPANRATLLYGAFGGARGEITTIISEYENLPKLERAGVTGGIAESIGSRGKLSLNEFESIGEISPELKRGLISGLDLYAAEDIARLGELKKICKAIEAQGEGNAGVFETVLSFRAAENLELVMREFETMGRGKGDGWKMLISELTKRNPEGVMNVLIKGNEVGDIRYAVSKWAEVDYSQAYDWFSNHEQTMAPKVADSMLATFVENQLKTSSIEDAQVTIGRIQDANIRKTAEGQVWSAERDALRKDVGNDPSGAIQGIVSGQSKYADYWLEEAMGTWVAKDFDKAQAWYQQNWKSLPASKSQYVAAAFANQATQQGDVGTARQWAALIQDAKTRDRINAGIAKAEAQPKP